MDQLTSYVQNNSSMINTVFFLVVVLTILYVVYTYMFPGADANYTSFLEGEADARTPIKLNLPVPPIHTGGEFTLSFWIYVDDWNFNASRYKFLFAISPSGPRGPHMVNPLVGVLTPLKNSLLVRAATTTPLEGSHSAVPDITVEKHLKELLDQNTSMSMFESMVDRPCDIKEVPLQRWTCVTIVSSGRVLDVYMDGKLTRSCVLDSVLNVPRGPMELRLGEFGGRFSSVQMWKSQLAPDAIYTLYQMGPTQTKHDVFTELAKYLNLNVTFTGGSPGRPVPENTQSSCSPLNVNDMYNSVSNAMRDSVTPYTCKDSATGGEAFASL